jgi:hypothetical protein
MDLGDRTVSCEIVDLSEGGLAVLTEETELPRGPVQLSFRLGLRNASLASIDAELVNYRRFGDTSFWGLRTLDADLGTRTRVRDLVLTQARR